ncbi:PLP-dependent aminotransferase family protein [Myroides albus]|uniref:Aminotransferase class I/II-fold pyridoxal phosphate-dependent enzyme n=1 Tax=Myroides albus TaxID=2562892 RepID=A0A6I3LTP4_9FLAO|nr:PLP-dependent aminotransferase family protein [Myroides albus]MTG99322.1 aminotransferase class I/II-fold pyridoxal phosphate-dependent enzyme [Myroides albus]UVD80033.1 PLP-dependent aminotransferase family protein [Myroides albus]
MEHSYIYVTIADAIASQIRSSVLQEGDRLPSIRALCSEYKISMNTAKRIYQELEANALIEVKPQSGYFVSNLFYAEVPIPEVSKPVLLANNKEPKEIIRKVYSNMGNRDFTLFSYSTLYDGFLPSSKMKKEIVAASRLLVDGGIEYDSVQGNLHLRRMIAHRAMTWGGTLKEEDIITTNGSMSAISLCMLALGKPGDTIAIESPCYPGIFQLAIDLGFKVLELPTDPITGIKVEALEEAVEYIDLCLLISNYNTPLGSCMPEENKRAIVALLDKHNIPLIEDDVYGDLYFGNHRPNCCKAFDKTGNVLWCSSVSKTLAPGYRVGWVCPGKYKDKILHQKLVHAISTPGLMQEAVASFMKSGNYDKHLRKLRQNLYSNYQKYLNTIITSFPIGTKVNRPQGGLSLWIEFDQRVQAMKLYDLAIAEKISIAPGRMFTVQEQFENCIRLCIGLPWSTEVEDKLVRIGELSKQLLQESR